jgi:hypothetical protein
MSWNVLELSLRVTPAALISIAQEHVCMYVCMHDMK